MINLQDLDNMIKAKYENNKENNIVVVDNTKHFKQSDNAIDFSDLSAKKNTDSNDILFDFSDLSSNVETINNKILISNDISTFYRQIHTTVEKLNNRRRMTLCLMTYCYKHNYVIHYDSYETVTNVFAAQVFNRKYHNTTQCLKNMQNEMFADYKMYDAEKHLTRKTIDAKYVMFVKAKENARLFIANINTL